MERYKDITGKSGITAYETGNESITVEFDHETLYLYTYKSAGKRIIEHMKALANAGKGLSTYISRRVKNNYERKLK